MQKYISTGVNGVDELLDGKGIPHGHTVLISGGPGSGKATIRLIQVLIPISRPSRGLSIDSDI